MEPSATSTTVTGPVGERLQASIEDAPVLDRPAPLRRVHDSGAGYKYPDLLTYFHHANRYCLRQPLSPNSTYSILLWIVVQLVVGFVVACTACCRAYVAIFL